VELTRHQVAKRRRESTPSEGHPEELV